MGLNGTGMGWDGMGWDGNPTVIFVLPIPSHSHPIANSYPTCSHITPINLRSRPTCFPSQHWHSYSRPNPAVNAATPVPWEMLYFCVTKNPQLERLAALHQANRPKLFLSVTIGVTRALVVGIQGGSLCSAGWTVPNAVIVPVEQYLLPV